MERQLKQWLYFLLFSVSIDASAEALASLYSATPPLLNKTTDPLVMLVMSVDHELFKKAYSDYSDLDNDGVLDTTYNDTFDYLGYFDSQWCYSYNTTKNHYQPKKAATGSNKHFCTTSAAPWSGNFLNWATMSRIDILRKVLFGGKRFKDTENETILERAYLPRDIHSFVKVYTGTNDAPVSNLTPFNESVISLCNLAISENGPPVLRVARGAQEKPASTEPLREGWSRWASTEVRQCQWGADNKSDSPPIAKKLAENNVYVESCVARMDAESSSYCKSYVDDKYKPIGLLQRYGEDGNIRFGLISGSYDKNISGGLLRRNITRLAGSGDPTKDEINSSVGTFNSEIKGIIYHINQFRIAKYSYDDNKYLDCSTSGIGVSTFSGNASRATRSSKHCSNWGNPLAEMFLEALRYFSGEDAPSSQYDTDNDDYFISGLTKESWVSPQNASNNCANCSIILLSTGLNSFDTDQFGAANDVPGINGSAGVGKLTDKVGVLEAEANPDVSFPGLYLSDKVGGDRQCEETEISKLSDIRGICPEQPQLEGGFHLSGLAWHGRVSDLRPDIEGKQSVKTYAIQLAENIPSFSLDVAGKTVTFQPVCQAHSNRSECSLTDVVIERLASDGKSGKFLFTWEDSLWGNDYDYDASSSIEYCIGSACSSPIGESQVEISVRQEAKNANAETWYSYTVTGTDKDGIVLPFAKDTGSDTSQGQGERESATFTAVGNTAIQLPKPLWFAAKYGGFTDLDKDNSPAHDLNGDGIPDIGDTREWDNRNNITGDTGADGLPDNYFFARNPSLLELQLGQVLQDISARTSSATNVALVANDSKGAGALYQALFQPKLEFNERTITWGGMLHALFIDDKGWLREDTNGNDKLDDYSIDKIVELTFDPSAGQTLVQRYTVSNGNKVIDGGMMPLNDLKTIWDARESLSNITDLTSQRSFAGLASGGRHILTWLDSNNDHIVDEGETLPFVTETFSNKEGYLGVAANQVEDVVNYIRGKEIAGFRSRTIDYDLDSVDEVWRLGDIVHSTPKTVAAPADAYDARFGDSSYTAFKEKYKNRRHVVYVGANDGLIHAFNGGFWDADNYAYKTTGSQSETVHPLGYELWAYAPMNLLPHLRWLTEADYPHVYYMDGESQAFDVNIFTADTDHPGGWGTILVMGMRLGGGAIDINAEGHSRTMRSGFVVLDITNPEKPPVLLAEITEPALGFTTSRPALVKQREPGTNGDWSNPAKNGWYLVFASGPSGSGESGLRDALENGLSNQKLKVFAYDLNNKHFVNGFDPLITTLDHSYGGDMTAVDWNQDYQDDAVYFGAVDTSATTLSGSLFRFKVNSTIENSSISNMLATGQPMTAAPLTVTDGNDYWIYGGTGRLLVNNDNRAVSKNSFYGVKEPTDSNGIHTYGSVNAGSLVDTTDVIVRTSGQVQVKSGSGYDSMVIGENIMESFAELKSEMNNQPGWKTDLIADGQLPSGKNVSQASHFFSMILFTEYQPSEDSCQIDGTSYLHGLNYITGTSTPDAVLGDTDFNHNDRLSLKKIDFGPGYMSSPAIHFGEKGQARAITQGAGGSIKTQALDYEFSSSGRQSWRQIFEIQ